MFGGLTPDLREGLVARRGDLALGAVPGGLRLRLRLPDDLFPAGLGILVRLVEERLDAVVRLGHQPAMLGQQLLALVAGLLRLEQAVLEMLLALVQRLGERPPGELAEQEEEPQEDQDRPDGQRGLGLHRIGPALALGGMARSRGMARLGLGFHLALMTAGLGRLGGLPAGRGHEQCVPGNH